MDKAFAACAERQDRLPHRAMLLSDQRLVACAGIVILLFTQHLTIDSLVGLGIFLSNAFGARAARA